MKAVAAHLMESAAFENQARQKGLPGDSANRRF
jgi:hypothetical protein